MIRPDDPWYPSPPQYPTLDKPIHKGYPGVPIRLKLAAMAMQAIVSGSSECEEDVEKSVDEEFEETWITDAAYRLADAMIERANREEADDGK